MTRPKAPSRVELELLLEKAREMAKSAPEKAAMVLTGWLNRPRKLANIRGEAPASSKTGTVLKKKAG